MIRKLIFIITMALANPALADMNKARAAHEAGDFKTAYDEFLAESKQNNTQAMVMLGIYYAEGNHVTRNFEKSNEWMLKAAELGDPVAMRNLGYAYKAGMGNLRRDPKKAFEWYMKAAEAGEAEAQFEVGMSYHYGIGANLNLVQAREWYLKAAEQNHDRAQNNLATMYAEGHGMPVDTETAISWLKKSAENNNYEALFSLGIIHHQGAEGIKQDYNIAADYFRKSFIEGKAEAAAYLAEYAYTGNGMEQDPITALMWIKLATEITSTVQGGELSEPSYERLSQNKSFLESTLDTKQIAAAKERMDKFMKENLE